MSASQVLISAAAELKCYIDRENERLKNKIKSDDLDLPSYHDYQTCQELAHLAAKLTNNKH